MFILYILDLRRSLMESDGDYEIEGVWRDSWSSVPHSLWQTLGHCQEAPLLVEHSLNITDSLSCSFLQMRKFLRQKVLTEILKAK